MPGMSARTRPVEYGSGDERVVVTDERDQIFAFRGLTLWEAGMRDPHLAALIARSNCDIEQARKLARAGCPDELIVAILL